MGLRGEFVLRWGAVALVPGQGGLADEAGGRLPESSLPGASFVQPRPRAGSVGFNVGGDAGRGDHRERRGVFDGTQVFALSRISRICSAVGGACGARIEGDDGFRRN